MRRPTLKASESGKEVIAQARIHRGWKTSGDDRPLQAASQTLDATINWKQVEYFAANISFSTWSRFLIGRKRIRYEAFIAFCQALDLNWEEIVDAEIYRKPVEKVQRSFRDLSEAPDLLDIYGRESEIQQMSAWFDQDGIRLAVLYGQGGIGKTAFGRSLLEAIDCRFDRIIWRSLKQAASLEELLRGIFEFLEPNDLDVNQPLSVANWIKYCQTHKCLLVLDDWESILGSSSRNPYLNGYQDYGTLLERMVNDGSNSCILLLSREKPVEVKTLINQRVKSHKLSGLSVEAAKQILYLRGLHGKEEYLERLGQAYNNPKVLQLVADEFMEALGGKIGEVAVDASTMMNDAIAVFLEQQFRRLTAAEEYVIYWLVIRRNTATIEQLQADVKLNLSSSELMQTLSLLRGGRCLVELDEDDCYVLDGVVLKYLTIQMIEQLFMQLVNAIDNQSIQGNELFVTHALLTPSCQDKLLEPEQVRRIIKPIQNQLRSELGGEQQMQDELERLRQLVLELRSPNYAAGNLTALLREV
jgi:hypothetical protein